MTDEPALDDDGIVALFLRSQSVLNIDDYRLQLGNGLGFAELETLTKLCFAVAEISGTGATPADLALTRLACTTGALLTTSVIDAPDNRDICNEWLSAREEYQLLTMPAGN